MIRYCIFHRKPWFVLGYKLAKNWEEAMQKAVMEYGKFPNFLKREDMQAAPSMYQGNLESVHP